MIVNDLNHLIRELQEIVKSEDPNTEVAFSNPNCWRSLKGRDQIVLTTEIVEVKRHYSGYAPLSVINGKRGYMEDYTQELLNKPTLQVLHIKGIS